MAIISNMNWWYVLGIALLGALGGLANCFGSGEFSLPRLDSGSGVWRPGWVGNVVVGSVAALVTWGVYGPMASYDLVNQTGPKMAITVGHLFSSIIVGFGGGKFLTLLTENQAQRVVSRNLSETVSNLTEQESSASDGG